VWGVRERWVRREGDFGTAITWISGCQIVKEDKFWEYLPCDGDMEEEDVDVDVDVVRKWGLGGGGRSGPYLNSSGYGMFFLIYEWSLTQEDEMNKRASHSRHW